ncbi:hypothetical protein CDAR_570091 [Caerostris darwini]|uniref:Secreted protein n=1 Tax=Caerostris darwini TaxID=1538125 RepID=A0AAV4S1K0_9ARAC|nr:hypothetical protein CDAR_570091 [Caerostris darwini]
MFSLFFNLVKIVCRSAPFVRRHFFHFVPIIQSGSLVKMWVPRADRWKMTFSQISRSCESGLNWIRSCAPTNTKMAAATVVGGKVPPTATQKMLPLLERSE